MNIWPGYVPNPTPCQPMIGSRRWRQSSAPDSLRNSQMIENWVDSWLPYEIRPPNGPEGSSKQANNPMETSATTDRYGKSPELRRIVYRVFLFDGEKKRKYFCDGRKKI